MKPLKKTSTYSSSGFSLIEMMISITLGLLIVFATLSIFDSNKQTYRSAENLSRVQENGRTAFELLGSDVREASGSPCSRGIPIESVLIPAAMPTGTDFWSDWLNPVRGFDDTGPNASDTLQLKSSGEDLFLINNHNLGTSTLEINNSQNHNLLVGDIVILCNYVQGAIFQISNVNGNFISHAQVVTGLNSTANLGPNGNPSSFISGIEQQATISHVNVVQWFVAANGRGGNSLFRSALRNVGGAPSMVQEEIAEGVNDMQVSFLLPGNTTYVAASTVVLARWEEALAVRVAITFESTQAIGTDGARIQRPMIQTFNLRNRMQ